jgi:hypothetical protein
VSTATEQTKAFKKKQLEALDKEVVKLNDLMTSKVWLKLQQVEQLSRSSVEQFRDKIDNIGSEL